MIITSVFHLLVILTIFRSNYIDNIKSNEKYIKIVTVFSWHFSTLYFVDVSTDIYVRVT